MDPGLRAEVGLRAAFRCEYCLLTEADSPLKHELEHIVSQQHGGLTVLDNLALACVDCNRHKGPNLSGIDPITGALTRLFDPRRDAWLDHFFWTNAVQVGRTAVGRATIYVLAINTPHRVAAREWLLRSGVIFVPTTAGA